MELLAHTTSPRALDKTKTNSSSISKEEDGAEEPPYKTLSKVATKEATETSEAQKTILPPLMSLEEVFSQETNLIIPSSSTGQEYF